MMYKAAFFNDIKKWNEIYDANGPETAKMTGSEVRDRRVDFDNPTSIIHAMRRDPQTPQMHDIGLKSMQEFSKIRIRMAQDVIRQKFSQISQYKQLLLSTGERIIAEASPYDPYWGIGLRPNDNKVPYPSKWKGHNHRGKWFEGCNELGTALMVIRQEFRDQDAAAAAALPDPAAPGPGPASPVPDPKPGHGAGVGPHPNHHGPNADIPDVDDGSPVPQDEPDTPYTPRVGWRKFSYYELIYDSILIFRICLRDATKTKCF